MYFYKTCICLLLFTATRCEGNTPLQLVRHGESLTASPDDEFHKIIRVPSPRFRLPTEVAPYHYDLRLRPILTNDPSDGQQWTIPAQVTIYATCVEPTRNITLQSTVPKINEAFVKVTNVETGMSIPIEAHTYISEKDFYVISVRNTLQIGQRYAIFIDYVANLHTNRMDGIYRSHYADPLSGETKYYATTQFQAFGARSAFPCFDEPGLKATFNTTIGRRTNYTTLSNTPVISTSPIEGLDGWVWDSFKQTVPMPTYLIALIISDYTYAEASKDLYGKPTRTYGPKYLMDQGYGDFAAEVAAKDLAYFEKFLDIEYSLDKMDSAAMWDFAAGAMENWGLNIYRDYLILYGPNQNHERERRQVSQTLAHELAHQWFGNLVTCGWWTGAWLNEGFASYFQYLGLNHTNPEFESLKTMQNDAMQNAMRSDVLPDAHPTLLPDKGNPYDTMSYNANLVYSRGAAIIRMMEQFLSLETLQKGLQNYLKRYAFGAVFQDDLFESLTEQAMEDGRLPSGVTVKDIMDTWTLQKGYPLLKVRQHTADNTVTISQEEDLGTFKGTAHVSTASPLWWVPLRVATQSSPSPGLPQHWLSTREMTIPHNSAQWIDVNAGGMGYFRVEYDAVLTQRLQDQLVRDSEVLSVGTRSQLIDDYFTRAFTGNQQIGAALGFTRHFENELEYVVWAPFFFHMAKPYRLFSGSEVFQSMKSYILPKITNVLNNLKKSRDVNVGINNLLQAQLLDWACGMEEAACLNRSLSLFEQWKADPSNNPIDPILRPVVYCTAIAHNRNNFDFALNKFSSASGTDKTQLLTGLGCARDAEAVSLLLSSADGTNTTIPKQYALATLQSLAANHLHRSKLSAFIEESIADIINYNGDATIISNTIRTLSSYFASAQELSFVNALAAQHSDMLGAPGVVEVIEAAITGIESNVLWMARFKEQFHNWFNSPLHFNK